MNDLERDLRELLQTKSRDAALTPDAPPKVLKRARWREAGTVLTAIACAAAIVVGSIAGLQALNRTDTTTRPGGPPVLPDAPEGFRSVVLPFASIAYPDDWFLVSLDPASSRDRVLQLTNFDVGTGWAACEQDASLPPDGVLLEVRLGALQEPLPAWPTTLAVVPGAGACGADGVLGASWTASGTAFSALALLASDAAQNDIERLEGAFASLTFPEAAPQTEEFLGTSNLVLDTADSPVGPVALYAFEDLEDGTERGSYWIGIAGLAGSHLSGASQISRDPPLFDESVTMNLDVWGGVVWGDVAENVARAELRTVEGATFPATLVQLPESSAGGQAVWGIVEGTTADRVTTLLYDAQGDVLNDYFPIAPRVTIATGEDPEGGPWELYLETTSDGTGLGFTFTTAGGGGGCCLQPLEGDFQLDGWGSGSGEPSDITALASEAVTRVVFEAASGVEIEGSVYPVPDETLGIPQVALVIVPSDVPLEGDLVAFDADGNELGRELITASIGEPPGPTPEIDAVWTLLRSARDAIGLWAADHSGSLESFSLEEARSAFPEIVWNASGQGKPVPHQVSIRGIAPAGGSELTGWSGWTLAIVSTTPPPPFHTYCIAVNIDENGGGNFRYGIQDAADYTECRGGWPELG